MEVKYKSADGQFEVTLDVKGPPDLFKEIAAFQEVFESGGEIFIKGVRVPNEHVQFRVRKVDDNEFFEKVYIGPDKNLKGFKLVYGQHKKGGPGLFPKKFLDEEDRATHEDGGNGWRRWKGDGNKPQSNENISTGKQVPF